MRKFNNFSLCEFGREKWARALPTNNPFFRSFQRGLFEFFFCSSETGPISNQWTRFWGTSFIGSASLTETVVFVFGRLLILPLNDREKRPRDSGQVSRAFEVCRKGCYQESGASHQINMQILILFLWTTLWFITWNKIFIQSSNLTNKLFQTFLLINLKFLN